MRWACLGFFCGDTHRPAEGSTQRGIVEGWRESNEKRRAATVARRRERSEEKLQWSPGKWRSSDRVPIFNHRLFQTFPPGVFACHCSLQRFPWGQVPQSTRTLQFLAMGDWLWLPTPFRTDSQAFEHFSPSKKLFIREFTERIKFINSAVLYPLMDNLVLLSTISSAEGLPLRKEFRTFGMELFPEFRSRPRLAYEGIRGRLRALPPLNIHRFSKDSLIGYL